MSLGYALVHPARLDAALANEPHKAGFDDGFDVVRAAIDLKNPKDVFTALHDKLLAELRALITGAEGLLADAAGALSFIPRIIDLIKSGGGTVADWVGRVADLLLALDPATLKLHLDGAAAALAVRLPILQGATLIEHLKDLLYSALDVFERPFLSGQNDAQAVRGYRAGAFIRNLLDPLLDGLLSPLKKFDLPGMIQAQLELALASLDTKLLAMAAKIGRFLKDNVVGLLGAVVNLSGSASLSVSVGGPHAMPDADPTYDQDDQPVPFPRTHPLWGIDLAASCTSFVFWFLDWWRIGWFPRASTGIQYVINLLWQPARILVRAIRPDSVNSNSFLKVMFSEWGEFAIQLLLNFIGAFGEAGDFNDFCLTWGLGILKYVTMQLQPRLPYLVGRSFWHFFKWKDAFPKTPGEAAGPYNDFGDPNAPPSPASHTGDTGQAPRLSRERFTWIALTPAWLLGSIFGLAQPWEDLSVAQIQTTSIAFWITTMIVSAAAVPLFYYLGFPTRVPGQRYFEDNWLFPIAFAILNLFMTFIGFGALRGVQMTRDPGAPNDSKSGMSSTVFAVLALFGVIFATGLPLLSQAGTVFADNFLIWMIGVLGGIFPGVVLQIIWTWIKNDGRDARGVFQSMDPTTSPYLLPYPKGDRWMTGQGFHGIFSHTYASYAGSQLFSTQNFGDNHYAYDFNHDNDSAALAARGGYVTQVEQDQRHKNGTTNANIVEVMNLDWVAGHDRGTDDERVISYQLYYHLDFLDVWVQHSQRVAQGLQLANTDCTGISAVHHLHFQSHNYQAGGDGNFNNLTQPVLFKDGDVQGYRPFAHIAGSPHSMRFYTSDNQQQPAQPRPIWLWTAQTNAHQHSVQLTTALLGDLSQPVTVRTSVVNGHYHVVTFQPSDLASLMKRQPITVSTVGQSHVHAMQAEDISNDSVQPPAATFPDVGGTGGTYAVNALKVAVAAPPTAQLYARAPEPYNLLGAAPMVLRMNGNATEFFPFGVHRPSLIADLAIDRHAAQAVAFSLGGSVITSGPPATTLAVPGAEQVNTSFATQAAATGVSPRVVRPEPVLVFETIATGAGVSIAIDPAAQASQLGYATGTAQVAGSGLPLDALPLATLGSELTRATKGPRTQPAGFNASISASKLSVTMNGNPVTFAGGGGVEGSTPRIAFVLNAVYQAATHAVHSAGELPLGSGRLTLTQGANTMVVPLAASPSVLTVPLASISGAGPLDVAVYGVGQTVILDGSETTPTLMAARIMAQAEGVRAFPDAGGTNVIVQTVSGGDDVTLQLLKGTSPFPAPAGQAPAPRFAGGTANRDSALIAQDRLLTAIQDAFQLLQLDATNDPGFSVSTTGGLLQIAHATATAITVTPSTNLLPLLTPVPQSPPSGVAVQLGTAALPATLAIRGDAWIDIDLTLTAGGPAQKYRCTLVGEPARLEVPVTNFLASGALPVVVSGGASANASWTSANTVEQVAFQLAQALIPRGVTVRLATRFVFESGLNGCGQVLASPPLVSSHALTNAGAGLMGAGFLADPAAAGTPLSLGARGAYRDLPLSLAVDVNAPAAAQGGALVANGYNTAIAGSNVTLTGTGGATLKLDDENSLTSALTVTNNNTNVVTLAANVALPRESAGWILARTVTSPTTVTSETRVELSAIPPLAAGVNPFTIPTTPLTITVTPPTGAALTATIAPTEFSRLGAGPTATQVAAVIQRLAPFVKCWGVAGTVLNTKTAINTIRIQARGGGTGWTLTLGDLPALTALGFDPASFTVATTASGTTPDAGTLRVTGSGNVADGRNVTAAEVHDAFLAAAPFLTVRGAEAATDRSVPYPILVNEPHLPYQYWGNTPLAAPSTPAPGVYGVPNQDAPQPPTAASAPSPTVALPAGLLAPKAPYLKKFLRVPQQFYHLLLVSRRDGSTSSVIPLAKPSLFRFERSLQRGPAVRASVALPTFGAATKHLAGSLWILLDDNTVRGSSPPSVISGVATAQHVQVTFPEGDYDLPAVTAIINGALGAKGSAVAYDDGVIVIETATNGLQGSVEVPSQAASDASAASVVSAFGLSATAPLQARGWPGAGVKSGAAFPSRNALPDGFRSKPGGTPTAGTVWKFTPSAGVPVPFTIAAGATVQSVAAALDTALQASTSAGARTMWCILGYDNAIYIEALGGNTIALTINGAAPAAVPPSPPPGASGGPANSADFQWNGGWDIPAEPGHDLRQTNTLRTFRSVVDPKGNGAESDFIDMKWIRPPNNMTGPAGLGLLNTPAVNPAPTGIVTNVAYFPDGTFLMAARAEGAKPDSYTPAGEMVIGVGSANIEGETVSFVRQARYWIDADNTLGGLNNNNMVLVGVRKIGDEVLPYWVR